MQLLLRRHELKCTLQKMFFTATMRAQTVSTRATYSHTHNRINTIVEEFELSRASENDRKVFTCRILPALQEFTVKIDCLKSELKNHGNVKKWQTPLALFDDVKRFCKEISELLNEYKLPLKCKAEMGRLHRCRSRCSCQQQ